MFYYKLQKLHHFTSELLIEVRDISKYRRLIVDSNDDRIHFYTFG